MASPVVHISAVTLVVDTAAPQGRQPQLFFSVNITSAQGTVTLGPLSNSDFAAIAAMLEVPGGLTFEAFSGQARNILRKAVKLL